MLRAKYLVDAIGLNKVQGKPFKQAEIEAKIEEVLGLAPGKAAALSNEQTSTAAAMATGTEIGG
jgi:hypothetical protein